MFGFPIHSKGKFPRTYHFISSFICIWLPASSADATTNCYRIKSRRDANEEMAISWVQNLSTYRIQLVCSKNKRSYVPNPLLSAFIRRTLLFIFLDGGGDCWPLKIMYLGDGRWSAIRRNSTADVGNWTINLAIILRGSCFAMKSDGSLFGSHWRSSGGWTKSSRHPFLFFIIF